MCAVTQTEDNPHTSEIVSPGACAATQTQDKPRTSEILSKNEISTSQANHIKGSTFRASAFKVDDQDTLPSIISEFTKQGDYSSARHNIVAYHIHGEGGYDDDGEHGAGERLCKHVQELNVQNIVLVVSRWYDGTHIGHIRHQLMKDCTTEAINGIHPSIVISPNLRRGLKQNFVAKSGILGFFILFGRFLLYEKKY